MLEPYDCPHDFLKIDDVAREYIETEKTKPGEIIGLRTGYDNLDEFTGGFQPGELIVVSGYPHMGKRFFLLNVALNVAVKQQIPVAYFSLGEKRWSLVERVFSSLGKFSSHRLKTGFMREEDNAKFSTAQQKLKSAPFFINDHSGLTVPEMKRDLDSLVKGSVHVDENLPGRHGVNIGLVIIDYLQLIQSWSEEGSRKNEIGVILDEIKRATEHTTNKAFDRYLQVSGEDRRRLYASVCQGRTI
jgi:replicative DNA helicase